MFKITKTGSGNYEYGCVFKPRVNGKVTALRCLMPEIDNYRVTLWDSSTKTILASVTITGDDTIYGNTVNIAPQAVKSGQPYLLSIRSIGKKWYEFRNHAGGQLSYPLSSNYIQVTGYLWKSTVAIGDPVFPTNISTTYISGLADFSFQPD
ncbi:MAG: DUF4082 domain-containing protein [Bacteroidetes bacterium]|nr:DUF4082 domain-containing protein [Bacteroidota bacterium]